MKIKIIIFDLDGVLIDLLDVHRDCFIESVKEVTGFQICKEFHDTWLASLPTKTKLKYLFQNPDICDKIAKLKQAKTLNYLKNLSDDTDLQMTLKSLYERGYILCVASNSVETTIKLTLEKLRIIGVFDGIRGNDTVDSPKPDPDMYYAVICDANEINNTDILVNEVLVIEDSEIGRQAIEQSGCHGLMVGSRKDVTLQNILNRIKEIEHS